MKRKVITGFMAALALAAGVACAAAQEPPKVTYWMMHGEPGTEETQMFVSDPAAVRFFAQPSNVVIYPVKGAPPPPPSWHVMLWRTYASYARFARDVADNRVGQGVQIVAYDLEVWKASPEEEQADPVNSIERFAQLAHAHGYKVMVTPAENLVLREHAGQNKFAAFEQSGIAKQVAPYVDFYHIQAQQLQHHLDDGDVSYLSFVRTIVDQVHSANPNAIVTVGITTSVPGREQTNASEIAAAVRATRGLVGGYWLNIVGPHGDMASQALSQLSNNGP